MVHAFVLALIAVISAPQGTRYLIIRENELGRYDTTRIIITWSCRNGNTTYVRTIENEEYWIMAPKERLVKDEIR